MKTIYYNRDRNKPQNKLLYLSTEDYLVHPSLSDF